MGPLCSGRPALAHIAIFRTSPRARSRHPLGVTQVRSYTAREPLQRRLARVPFTRQRHASRASSVHIRACALLFAHTSGRAHAAPAPAEPLTRAPPTASPAPSTFASRPAYSCASAGAKPAPAPTLQRAPSAPLALTRAVAPTLSASSRARPGPHRTCSLQPVPLAPSHACHAPHATLLLRARAELPPALASSHRCSNLRSPRAPS
jgi:hypothetical protein